VNAGTAPTQDEPCKVCGDPDCRQRPTDRILNWRQLEWRLKEGELVELSPEVIISREDAYLLGFDVPERS
jgi:hypothetical protein